MGDFWVFFEGKFSDFLWTPNIFWSTVLLMQRGEGEAPPFPLFNQMRLTGSVMRWVGFCFTCFVVGKKEKLGKTTSTPSLLICQEVSPIQRSNTCQ